MRKRYRVNVRAEPSLEAAQTGKLIQQQEEFHVIGEQAADDGQVFFLLADNSGWGFRQSGAGDVVVDPIAHAPLQCRAKVALGVRSEPSVTAGRTDRVIAQGDVFTVSRRVADKGDKNQMFFELAEHDGLPCDGWVFRATPDGKVVVEELEAPNAGGACCIR